MPGLTLTGGTVDSKKKISRHRKDTKLSVSGKVCVSAYRHGGWWSGVELVFFAGMSLTKLSLGRND
jgi:hypothetical protein